MAMACGGASLNLSFGNTEFIGCPISSRIHFIGSACYRLPSTASTKEKEEKTEGKKGKKTEESHRSNSEGAEPMIFRAQSCPRCKFSTKPCKKCVNRVIDCWANIKMDEVAVMFGEAMVLETQRSMAKKSSSSAATAPENSVKMEPEDSMETESENSGKTEPEKPSVQSLPEGEKEKKRRLWFENPRFIEIGDLLYVFGIGGLTLLLLREKHRHELKLLNQEHQHKLELLKQRHQHELELLNKKHQQENQPNQHKRELRKQQHQHKLELLKQQHQHKLELLKQQHQHELSKLKKHQQHEVEDHYTRAQATCTCDQKSCLKHDPILIRKLSEEMSTEEEIRKIGQELHVPDSKINSIFTDLSKYINTAAYYVLRIWYNTTDGLGEKSDGLKELKRVLEKTGNSFYITKVIEKHFDEIETENEIWYDALSDI